MKSKIIHRSNIPGLKTIEANRLSILLKYTPDNKIQSFSIETLNLSGLKLPPNASVDFICELEYEELYFHLGTVETVNLNLGENFDLSQKEINSSPLFRIIVFLPDNPKLLATSDNLRAKNNEDNTPSKSLLPVESVNWLGERLWKLSITDHGPILQVNNNSNINMVRLLQDNILLKGAILPEIISQVYRYIILKNEDKSLKWLEDWRTFALQYGVDINEFDPPSPEDLDDEYIEKIERTIDNIVTSWCGKINLCEQVIVFEENK